MICIEEFQQFIHEEFTVLDMVIDLMSYTIQHLEEDIK